MGGLFGLAITHARLAVSDVPTNQYIVEMLTLQIYQRLVDTFWKDSKPPCCQVKVIAQNTPEIVQHLNYPVPITNIDPENTVFIQCSLTEIKKTCELWEM